MSIIIKFCQYQRLITPRKNNASLVIIIIIIIIIITITTTTIIIIIIIIIILETLHWLPVKERIIFKILLFVYYIVNGTAPDYNRSLLRLYQPTRTLRSSNSGLLQIPLSKKSWGERAFAHAGPALWNSLPQELKDSNSSTSFKCNLKTHLFNLAF